MTHNAWYIRIGCIALLFAHYPVMKSEQSDSCPAYDRLAACVTIPEELQSGTLRAAQAGSRQHRTLIKAHPDQYPALFRAYPQIAESIPWMLLGTFPTSIQQLHKLGTFMNIDNLYIKRDDLSGKIIENGIQLFGGNKVRKLQFLLADAVGYGAKTVVTRGCYGSNHAVATATYAARLGLACIALLSPQLPNGVVQRNLLLMAQEGCQVQAWPNGRMRNYATLYACVKHQQDHGDFPYCITTGGSNALGALGFVDAVFELKEQIDQGSMPCPDVIYVAGGSFGTTAGLLLGIHLLGLNTRIISIVVEPLDHERVYSIIKKLFEDANTLLHNADARIPLSTFNPDLLQVDCTCAGKGYGIPTKESNLAAQYMLEREGITLDSTYTAKAFGALVRDAEAGILKGKTVLFWNTFCAQPLPQDAESIDYAYLPLAVQKFCKSTT